MKEIKITKDGKVIGKFPVPKDETVYDFFFRLKAFGEDQFKYTNCKVYSRNTGKYLLITSEHPFMDGKIGIQVYSKDGQLVTLENKGFALWRHGYTFFDSDKTVEQCGFKIRRIKF